MKRTLSVILTLCMLLGCFSLCVGAEDGTMKDSGLSYTESTTMLANPHMGYPNHQAISMTVSGNKVYNNSGFTWYYVNISAFSGSNSLLSDDVTWPEDRIDQPISEDALNAFRATLENLRYNGGSCLIRFVYDWDGQAGREPGSLDMILTHIRQLCAVVSDFADICLGFECGIIGVFGEMHSSIYCGSAYANPIIDAYLDNTPDSMILMVRSPAYMIQYLGMTREELATYVTEKGSPEYRLSYFNDGYMNTDNDTGTWYNRTTDLAFLASQSEHATYGGEYGSAYWLLPSTVCLPERAIPEMYQTHVNFIRGNVYKISDRNPYFGYDQYTYSQEYEEDWYPNNSAFYGKDCHNFITAHLGYRLVLRESKLSASPKAGGTLHLTGSIENTGFANILHYPETQILLVKNGFVYACGVSLDASELKSCTVTDYDLTLNLPSSMPTGEYEVYMRIAASTQTFFTSAKSGIRFANEGDIFNATIGANHLGTITVGGADVKDSAASDVFCELGENCIPDGLVSEGAPTLFGIGLPVSGSLNMVYAQGDTVRLRAANMLRSDASVTYAWYKDNTLISTEAELVLENVTDANEGTYKLSVKSGGDSATTMSVIVGVSDHVYTDYQTVSAPTCHTPGKAERTCSHCGATESKLIPTTAHTEGAPVTVGSSCTVRGTVVTTCTACGDEMSKEVLDLLPHNYEAEITAPTCTVGGKRINTCVDCGHSYVEAIDELGHNYIYKIEGNTASATCSRCFESLPSEVFDGNLGAGVSSEDFNGTLSGAVSVDSAPLTLIGEGGYLSDYTADGAAYLTFLFRMDGIDEPVQLGKFRTLAYAKDDTKNLGDSNDNANYYGNLLFEVSEDGVWAFSIRKYLMLNRGNSGFGKIAWAAFNDADSTKGLETDNPNANATFELLGVYESLLNYNVVYTDAQGNFIQHQKGGYNANLVWSNLITRVKTVDELYTGEVPTKLATEDTIYTFAGWECIDGSAADLALGNLIVKPVFTESENVCTHPDYKSDIITPATCTVPGTAERVCVDCGYAEVYEFPTVAHSYENGACTVCGGLDIGVRYGDVDGNGEVNATDSMFLTRYTGNWDASTYAEALYMFTAGDVDGNGEVNATDSIYLTRYTGNWDASTYAEAVNLLKTLEKFQ